MRNTLHFVWPSAKSSSDYWCLAHDELLWCFEVRIKFYLNSFIRKSDLTVSAKLSGIMRKRILHMRKQSCRSAVTTQLISAFVFATQKPSKKHCR